MCILRAQWRRVHKVHVCMQAAEHVRQEGLNVHYRRVPLSRNRTPAALDMQELHSAVLSAGPQLENVKFVVLARSASTSTSSSFVAHFLALYMNALVERGPSQAAGAAAGALRANMASLGVVSSPGRVQQSGNANSLTGNRSELHSSQVTDEMARQRSVERLMSGKLPELTDDDLQEPAKAPEARRQTVGGAPQRLANSTISNLCRCVPSIMHCACIVHVAVEVLASACCQTAMLWATYRS